ncbi:RibD family protein [Streptomyces sp. SCSIO ZS0520]|uniref:RibD family protein n=1 Tax=Streptomyces sp. SCSIO ZS0520 TaxID=2892996 RepID=UPI00398714DC
MTTAAPYVLLSCAASLDGYIDDTTTTRLLLSNEEDFDRVDAVRAECDAILVGANTIRRDNPRLLIRSEQRRAARAAAGRTKNLVKVTVSTSGDLDPEAKFFTTGGEEKIVYAASSGVDKATARLGERATVVDAGESIDLPRLLADLDARGVHRLMVEGGSSMHTQFLTAGLADELHLVLAPFFVGDRDAPRFVGPGTFANGPGRHMRLAETRQIGDCVLLRYLPAH